MQERVCRVAMSDVAKLTGQTIETVQRHRRLGWFDMKNPASVIRYTQAQMVLDEIEPKEPRRGD